MVLSVENQYYLSIVIGDKDDFIANEDDLQSCVVCEEAGNVLPTFELRFLIRKESEDTFKYLNEGNIVKMTFGETVDRAVTSEFIIEKMFIQRNGQTAWDVTISGFYNAMAYLAESKIWASGLVSGVECIQSKISGYFKPEFNIGASSDSQYWIQHNTSDRKFITDVWLHSYRPDSFVCVGISSDGKFILKDIKADGGAKWEFGSEEDPEIVKFGPDYCVETRTGLMNHWAGFSRDRTVWNQDADEYADMTEQFKPILAQSEYFDRSSAVGNRIFEFRPINENVHENYWKAWRRNVTSLALFSSIGIVVEYSDKYREMKVLDRVYIQDDKAEPEAGPLVQHSGYYYLTHITRRMDNKKCSTTVKLSREALSEIKGDLR